jgi:hypothetical protein
MNRIVTVPGTNLPRQGHDSVYARVMILFSKVQFLQAVQLFLS